jgi:flagellar operon protein
MNDFKSMQNNYMLKRAQIDSVQRNTTSQTNQVNRSTPEQNFNEVLQKIQNSSEVKFSKHALDRLNARQISLSDVELTRLNSAVSKADKKGVREALIMMDDKVFIASVKNKTIITAALEDQLKENVFTNIDGAVII